MEEAQYIAKEGTSLDVTVHRAGYIGGADYAGGTDLVSKF